eukprot:1931113-Pleurochrysis_carterae.AAC.1
MIRRRNLRTRAIKMLVIDEADEMLSKGFKEQIYDIYRYLPPATQVVLISATLPHEILEMTRKFMTDPVRILVKRDELTLEGIKQFFVAVEARARGRERETPWLLDGGKTLRGRRFFSSFVASIPNLLDSLGLPAEHRN